MTGKRIMSFVLITVMVGFTLYFTFYGAQGWYSPASGQDMLLRTWEHIKLVGIAELLAIGVGISGGLLITRPGLEFLATPVTTIANVGLAIPPLALVAGVSPFFGIGPRPGIIALFIYSLLPVLRNATVGIEDIDKSVIESARGMGMSKLQIFTKIELPLALPVIVAGIRTSTILCVGTAAIAALINAGGLGQIIMRGQSVNFVALMLQGALLTAALAVTLDLFLSEMEHVLTPRGLKLDKETE
ncbi:MAG: ABC transporter permease [Candidatus Bipolaricaulota bacterium]